MATMNPFDLLGGDDNDDPSQLIAAAQAQAQLLPAAKPKKSPTAAQAATAASQPAKLPSKPLPPAQAVREARNGGGRGSGRGGGRGFGRGHGGGRGFDRDAGNTENAFAKSNGYAGGYKPSEDGDSGKSFERRGGPRGPFRGERRGGFSNGEAGDGERPRRVYERRSGTGRGSEVKRDGAGRGNWGTPEDEIAPEAEEAEKVMTSEKLVVEEGTTADANKDAQEKEPEEKEPEDKEMTLEEYQKVLEEKRKVLLAEKAEERKVDLDKEFKSMQLLSNKKANDDVFIKLGSEKDKRKDAADKEDKKKAVSINEFLKPADGERYYNPGGRGGRGRGRGSRGGYNGGSGGGAYNVPAPSIEDPGHFPTLGGKK
ncbi:hypothetical protein MLD38_020874 [Melastoma candidum]|uniref:Uncharacterized protein n=1 Tax=Melastoma candidum TaxID=119954 RepID=A0ACB9QHP3_9MYRT|nr:hypothetical protein MLD38_020874 [Melastoma candidum]